MSKYILLTGGAGYIGSHTAVQLMQSGKLVIILDNLSNSTLVVIERLYKITGVRPVFIEGDVLNRDLLQSIFKYYPIESVIHFAGLKSVSESVKFPLKYYINNVLGTLTLIEEMSKFRLKTLIFSSSATVYGNPDSLPINEDFPLKALNPYGESKIMVEKILQDLYKSDNDWKIGILRYFNPIGAHRSGQIGENPRGIPNNLLPYIAQVALGKLEKLTIYGNDYSTTDGTGIRDYIHVEDLANGHIAIINTLNEKAGIITLNLGTGKGYSVLQVISAFQNASSRRIKYQISARREGDIAECYANTRRAFEVMGWVARYDLDRMCIDSWRWQSSNPLGYD